MSPNFDDYYKGISIPALLVSEDEVFVNHELFTDMMTEATCIIDYQKRNFYDVGNHDFFLCGYLPEKVKSMGYQFFNEIVHPDDIPLWAEMHYDMLRSLIDYEFTPDEVHYFSCTFHIKNSLQFRASPLY